MKRRVFSPLFFFALTGMIAFAVVVGFLAWAIGAFSTETFLAYVFIGLGMWIFMVLPGSFEKVKLKSDFR